MEGVQGGGGAVRMDKAIGAIQSSGSSWFRLAVLSGRVETVLWVYRYLTRHCEDEQVLNDLCYIVDKCS